MTILALDKKLYLSVHSRYTLGNMYFKIVAVGDDGVGKTPLLHAIQKNRFVTQVYREVPSDHAVPLQCTARNWMGPDGEVISYGLWDTAGHSYYDNYRRLSYAGTAVFLVCFSTVDPKSLERVSEKWIPEIIHHCPGTPFFLVGTQLDLKEDRATVDRLASKNQAPISSGVGLEIAKQVGASKYLECSSLTMEGVKNVIDQAIVEALKRDETSEKMMKTCTIS